MKYLLDACIISFFLRKESSIINKLQQIDPSSLCFSCITEFEIEYGFSLLVKNHKIYPAWYKFKNIIKILSFNREDSCVAAHIRSDLKRKGRPIGFYDLLIAATAKRHDLICVTDNLKEFTQVEGLKIENWKT